MTSPWAQSPERRWHQIYDAAIKLVIRELEGNDRCTIRSTATSIGNDVRFRFEREDRVIDSWNGEVYENMLIDHDILEAALALLSLRYSNRRS